MIKTIIKIPRNNNKIKTTPRNNQLKKRKKIKTRNKNFKKNRVIKLIPIKLPKMIIQMILITSKICYNFKKLLII